jgi:integrase
VTLALPGVVADVLRAHRVAQLAQAAAAGDAWQELALVFTTPTPKTAGHHRPPGSPVDYLAAHRRLRAVLAAAGLPAIRVHDLRHTCAVLLIEGGDANLKQVQRQMRHASIGVTLDVYGHVTDALQARAASDMGRLLEGPKTGSLATGGNTGEDPAAP